MTALIRHFGDTADSTKPCGHCDFCAPSAVTSQSLSEPTDAQQRQLRQILLTLAHSSKSTGQIHTALNLPDRKQTDDLLDGLARAGLLTLVTDTFTKPDGTSISYKKAALTHEGQTLGDQAPLEVLLRTTVTTVPGRRRRPESPAQALTPSQQSLEANLRAYRKSKAAETGKPAFIVFGDTALAGLVHAQPQTISELLTVSGFGPDKADKYGADITALCRGQQQATPLAPPPKRTAPRPKRSEPKEPAFHSAQQPASEAIPDYDYTPPADQDDYPPFYDYEAPETQPESRVALDQRYTLAPEPLLTDEPPTQRVADQSIRQPKPKPTAASPTPQSRPAPPPDPTTLTPAQQALELRLRTWRKSESERLGLPQFFILGTTTLRAIVTLHPTTLAALAAIPGLDPEKLQKYGPAILASCLTAN